jgi:hypothetical protein
LISDLLLAALTLFTALRGSVMGGRRGATELMGLSAGVAITATLLLVDLSPLLRALPAAGGLAAGLSLGAAEDDGAPLAIGERVAGLLLGALLGLLIASGLFVVNLDTATLRPFDENSLLLRAIAALLGGE